MNSLLSKLKKKKSALSNTVKKVTYLAMHKIHICSSQGSYVQKTGLEYLNSKYLC